MVRLGNDWDELLKDEWEKPYYKALRSFLLEEYRNETVYPAADDIFNALKLTAYKDVKVVILGQDPYHEPGQAEGLAFSVPVGMPLPPSLVNIYKELENDLGIEAGESGSLRPWAEQGVLLLNTVLTVRAHEAASHQGRGWEVLTDKIIELLALREEPMVFILWGAKAIAKKELILKSMQAVKGADAPLRHLIITAPHPSPLSAYRGFFGGRYFSRCNYFLADNDRETVDWRLN